MRPFFLLLGLVLLFISCETENNDIEIAQLTLISNYNLSVPEPSGLAFSPNGSSFYTVSDQDGKIYKLTMSGAITRILDIHGQDLEGIAVDPKTGDLFVIEERKMEVIKLNENGTVLNRKVISIDHNDENEGFEGISFNPVNKHLYVLNEKNPGLLIELNSSLEIISTHDLDFASDYSGICYDASENVLWIVSDESRTVTKCNLSGEKITTFRSNISRAEGITINAQTGEVYLVLDGIDQLQLYTF